MARNITSIAVMALSVGLLAALVDCSSLTDGAAGETFSHFRLPVPEGLRRGRRRDPERDGPAEAGGHVLAFVKAHPQSRMIPHVS